MTNYVGFWPPTGAGVWLAGVVLTLALPLAVCLLRRGPARLPMLLLYAGLGVQVVGAVMMTAVVSAWLYGP